jgi:AbiV family abortive infection protein
MSNTKVADAKPYTGALTPVNAANAIRSARINARDLLESAEILFSLKRFPHATALSILAIEEAAKIGMLLMIFLEIGGEHARLWRQYRNHRAKTSWLNPVIEGRIRAMLPKVLREDAKRIAAMGPSPEELETSKQRTIYSDCLDVSGCFVAHCPDAAEWRTTAWERLCEAQAIVSALRDYPPDELTLWHRHVTKAKAEDKDMHLTMTDLHKELLEKGFVQEGWWDTLLQDAEAEAEAPVQPDLS